jgi:hypothetical protein
MRATTCDVLDASGSPLLDPPVLDGDGLPAERENDRPARAFEQDGLPVGPGVICRLRNGTADGEEVAMEREGAVRFGSPVAQNEHPGFPVGPRKLISECW